VFVFDFDAPLHGPHRPIAPIQFNILSLGLHCFVIHVQLGVFFLVFIIMLFVFVLGSPFLGSHCHITCV
jgi:hypothetical protein